MSFVMLESGAVILVLLMSWEMRRQRLPWQRVIIRSVIALAILTTMILLWRGR